MHIIEQVEKVWIILDALNKCHIRNRLLAEGLLLWIKELLSSKQTNVHLLVTSQPEQDIISVVSLPIVMT